MAEFRTILTNAGKALVAAAEAGGEPIVITHMAVGDGNGNPVTPDEAQNYLARERHRAPLNTLTVNPANASEFIAEITIGASIGGFVMREAGLFNEDGVLIAVANIPDTYKPLSGEGAYSDAVVRMVFAVSNASVVTLILDPNVAIATRAWVFNNITGGQMIPGGLTNQVLAKDSNADGDFKWIDPTAAVEVIVHSREETQTLAANQTVVDLAILTSSGDAVYINGTRLRANQFTITGPTQITLGQSYAAGTQCTIVQNEEVGGLTDFVLKSQNLADLPDKAAARANLGLDAWLAARNIAWAKLTEVPAFASRWPTWGEVSSKPATFPPDAHSHSFDAITGKPATYPSDWNTTANKPATFTPAAHSNHQISDVAGLQTALNGKSNNGHTHSIAEVSGLQGALDSKAPTVNPSFSGTVSANAFARWSSERYKHTFRDIDGREALRLLAGVQFKSFFYTADDSFALGVKAEDLAGGDFDFAVKRDEQGRPDSVDYEPLFVVACAALLHIAEHVGLTGSAE